MYLVGVTGGIGSGKSTVAALLDERGATVVDVDAVARQVSAPGSPAVRDIADRFGPEVVDADGALDRAALAGRVFLDAGERAALEAITHPRIRRRLDERLAALRSEGAGLVVLDHPLLVETGAHERCDAVVVVTAPQPVRLQRLVGDRGMAPADVRARMAAQADDDQRLAVATHVVDNSGDRAALAERVDPLYQRLQAAAEERVGRARS